MSVKDTIYFLMLQKTTWSFSYWEETEKVGYLFFDSLYNSSTNQSAHKTKH